VVESDIATYLFSLMFFLGWIGGWGAEFAREAGQRPVALVPTIALAVYAAIAYVKHIRKSPSIPSLEEREERRTSKVRTLAIAQLGDLPIGLPFSAVVVTTLSVAMLRARPVGTPPWLFLIVLLGSLICAIPPGYALAAVVWRHRARVRGALAEWPSAQSLPAVRSALYVFSALFTLGASAGLTLAAVYRLGWTTLLIVPVPVVGALVAIRSYGSVPSLDPEPSVPPSP
jgi:hypothetical protein